MQTVHDINHTLDDCTKEQEDEEKRRKNTVSKELTLRNTKRRDAREWVRKGLKNESLV